MAGGSMALAEQAASIIEVQMAACERISVIRSILLDRLKGGLLGMHVWLHRLFHSSVDIFIEFSDSSQSRRGDRKPNIIV
jgi:hypothetical protein